MRVLSLTLAILLALSPLAARADARIKDIVSFEGVRENILMGYGLVVGLNGTGDKLGNDARTRLGTMVRTNDGFEISRRDLELRGPGELLGTRQTGMPDFVLADLAHHLPLLRTAHAGRVFTVRSEPALRLDELCGWVEQLRREHGHERILLAPSTEFFNRFALAHREALADCGAVLPLVEAPLSPVCAPAIARRSNTRTRLPARFAGVSRFTSVMYRTRR